MQVCAAVLVLLLAAGAAGQSAPPQGYREKGQAPESCYDSQLSSSTATVSYTRSAAPRETTFNFLVCHSTACAPISNSLHKQGFVVGSPLP